MKKLRFLFIMFLVLTLALYTKVEAATKEVELGQEKYEVKNGKEYTSRKEIEYIKILSDRSGTSRISLEFDLSLIKDYDSTNGIVEYNNLKKWLNNLEDVYDLFCELNLKPNKDEIVIDYTGIREQKKGAYVNGDSNRIVVNKQYNINSIKILDRDYNNGLINLDGTVIHEMGHIFTKIENGPSFTNEPWTYGDEYINQAMVQYVLDKIILSKDNIVTTINPYDYVIFASKNVKTYTNLNGEQKEVVHSYKDGYDKLLNKYNVYYPSDASYTKLIYNISAILDAIGLDSVKNVFNYYGNNDLSYYTWASKYDKFILFMNIVKQNTTNEIWNSVQSNYNEAYDKFVINISTGNIDMKVIKGKEFLPVYNVSYNSSNHKDNYQIKYFSKNSNIVQVQGNGKLYAKNLGYATIEICVGNQSETIGIEVVDGTPISSMEINTNSYTFTDIDDIYTPSVDITPSNATNTKLKWISSDKSIATVNIISGKITPVGNGKCKINVYATDGSGLVAQLDVKVDIKAKSVSFENSEYNITSAGQKINVNASVLPEKTNNKALEYKSSNEKIAVVDGEGNVTPVGNGTCQITATTTDGSNLQAKCNVNVDIKPIKVTDIKIRNKSYTIISLNQTPSFRTTITPSNATNKEVKWTSSNENVAVVSENGIITPVKNGMCKIIATTTDGTNLSASVDLTVNIPPTTIKLDKSSYTFNDTKNMQLKATILPTQASNTKLNWTSDNESIATVDGNGVVTPVKNGECNITATTADGTNIKGNCNITVDFKVKSISFSTTSYTITSVNQTPSFRAIISPSNAANKSIKWTSSDENVAKVSTNGVIKPVKNGTCKIIATTTDGTNLSASIDITVDIKATKITLDKTNINLTNEKYSDKITAKIEPSEASDKVKYTSSNEKVAKVKEDGTVIAVGKGNCIITATTTDGTNLSAKCNVTSEVEYQKGDVNKDGIVDVADVIYAMNKLSKGTLTDEEKIIGNVNDDSIFDVADVIKIMRYLSGKISSLS